MKTTILLMLTFLTIAFGALRLAYLFFLIFLEPRKRGDRYFE